MNNAVAEGCDKGLADSMKRKFRDELLIGGQPTKARGYNPKRFNNAF